MPYALYYATAPAPKDLSTHEAVTRLVPVYFSTEKDAIHAAALVIRGGEVEERCKPILQIFKRSPPKP